MASMVSSARDIPKASSRDSLTAVEARSVPATKNHSLPTPPNSISPSLPPQGVKPYGTRSTSLHVPEHVDSDIDLQEGQGSERDGVAGRGRELGSPGYDAAGNITPGLLARHHLPEILLNHGPLAIRHIMGFLTTAVPGFSGIPPAKARRLVVGALEGRGSGGEGGGVKGNVKFEKVGWGRWDARLKGHPARSSRGGNQQSPPPSAPSSYSQGMPIAQNGGWTADRNRLTAPESSWAGDSAVFSHEDDTMMLENEADKMSLDGGDDSCSSSEVPEDDVMADDDDMMTDEEDWAAVGAAALRAASYSASGPRRNFLSSHIYTGASGGGRSLSTMGKSVPARTLQPPTNIDFAAFGMTSDSQEREAVEALLRLGSV
ncbi:hypothetical protein VTL71DRAFT_8577 [Oculimacula yallundae]|uniref:Sin3 binding protein-domain-containing protein n=1 Tax=Oculimacula yallundae TaxID=86028 RepID=A0ABR4CZI3_9HELO